MSTFCAGGNLILGDDGAVFECQRGAFDLERYPKRSNDVLQAWDAADTLLVRQCDESDQSPGELLIVNDSWGALSTAFARHRPSTLTDSYLAHAAIRENLRRNQIDFTAIQLLTSFDLLPARIDTVLLKVPKSLALLEDQLHRIAPHLHDKTKVIAAGMTKHVHRSTLELFEKIVGPAKTSLAEKKARLIFCRPDSGLQRPPNPWPNTYTVAPGGEKVICHAGVFGDKGLDAGARWLLDCLPRGDRPLRIADLGCGNGILGVRLALGNPNAMVTFVDESYRAVASAEETFRVNLGPDRPAQFVVGNGLFEAANKAPAAVGFDRVLNNPPFHENHAISDHTAWQMFVESRDALRPGGELWVVGNRHLRYEEKLKRLFLNCDVIAGNPKFLVLRATRT